MQFLTKREEEHIRQILDSLAKRYNLLTDQKEVYERAKSLYLDRVWYVKIEEEKIPVVAFEIEKSVPYNERIRKDILNLVMSNAPRSYFILPHARIERAYTPDKKQICLQQQL